MAILKSVHRGRGGDTVLVRNIIFVIFGLVNIIYAVEPRKPFTIRILPLKTP